MSEAGTIGVLNVGAGDTKLSFDKNNPAERIRAARIVRDMLRRGYALLVEVKRGKKKAYERVKDFDENTCEYIIADFDPVEAQQADEQGATDEETRKEAAEETPPEQEAALKLRSRRGRRRLAAAETTGIAVARTAGG